MSQAIPAPAGKRSHLYIRLATLLVLVLLLLTLALMWWWDTEPAPFDVNARASTHAAAHGHRTVPGTTTASTLIELGNTLLDKRGGYLANDLLPPGALLDNIPNWEMGVVLQMRDLSLSLRNDFSRSQSQSVEDTDLREALNYVSYAHTRWLLPSTESQFRKGLSHVESYVERLGDGNPADGQFFTRADNLASYLELVGKRLGSLSQRLSASVGQARINTDLAGDPNAQQSKPAPDQAMVKTPWLKIDDVFYEARGTTWALLHILKAVEHDFEPVLADKNALVSLRQVIRELEESQAALRSPMVLNGSPYGFFANHSLVMANYVSRANAAVIELRKLLERG